MSQLVKLSLRRLDSSDADITFAWRNNPDVYKWCRQNDVLHYDNHLNWMHSQCQDKSISMYSIIDAGSEEMVGVCGLTSIDLVNRRAEFSLYIGPEHQGQGFGEAALRELVAKGFNAYGLNSIWGEAFDGNPAIKMFERVGFKREGVRREFYFREGKFVDAILFSLLRSQYVA